MMRKSYNYEVPDSIEYGTTGMHLLEHSQNIPYAGRRWNGWRSRQHYSDQSLWP